MTNAIKQLVLAATLVVAVASRSHAQKIYTKNGSISFYSKSLLEDITAKNNEVTSIINEQTGDIQFSVLIKSFRFKKSLMEQHFNEDYMESDKFPKAIFKGNIADLSRINFASDGSYKVKVTGDLTIHGVTKNIEVPGAITVSQGKISSSSKFSVKVKDYNIKIPTTVVNNIAETISITVDCKYEPYKKA